MVLQIWRHRPSGKHYAVYVNDGQVTMARGPMNPKEAASLTTTGFGEKDADPSILDVLNAAPWEYDPVWQQSAHEEEDAEWLRGIMEPDDDSTISEV